MVGTKSIRETTKSWVEGTLRSLPIPCPRCSRKTKAEDHCQYCKAKWTKEEITLVNKQRKELEKATIGYMILKFLEEQEWPSTTEDTANAVGVTWHTAQIHLFKLQAEGKIKYRKVGRQNQWWLVRKYEKEFSKH